MSKTRKITLAGLLGTIHIVILILANFLPGIELLLVVFVPTLTTLYSLYTKTIDLFIYTFALLIACFFFEPITTLLYLLPAILTGFFYGILVKKKITAISIIYLLTLLEMILFLLTNFFIKIIYRIDIIDTFKMLSKIDNFNFFIPTLILIIGLTQAFITHIVTKEEIQKLGFKVESKEPGIIYYLMTIAVVVAIFIVNFFSISYAFTLLLFSFLLILPVIIKLYIDFKYRGILIIIQLLAILFVLPLFNVLALHLYLVPLLIIVLIPFAVKLYEKFVKKVNKIV